MTDARQPPAERRIVLQGATKRFGDFTAVAPLDLDVRQGEFVALFGPTGAGKTTALRMIAGLEKPTAGAILIDGLDVTPMPPQRRDVALVFQSNALYPHMTVERNLAFPMRAQSIPANVIERRVNEVIDRLRLGHVRHCKPRKLSATDAQLVSLGRAMVRDAKAFLFDDPLAPFTGDHRDQMRRELRAIHEELRATTILATRDPLDTITTADRICVMNQGRVLQCDTPQAVYDRPADLFVAHYLGEHAMNFLDATYADGVARLGCADVSFRVADRDARPVDAAKITLGIRPEHVRIDPHGIAAVAGHAEPLGPDVVVELRFGDASIKAMVSSSWRVVAGETVPIRFAPDGCRWFDAVSGKALPWQTRSIP
ncbi:MAG: ABC transporter ATP-binding protein [Tepidisphaeraceae bacterium]